MNPVRQWIRKFPEADRRAITDALRSASLAKIRRASRMFEELAHDEGGPSVNVELLSTYNLEPVSAVMQFALNCIPGQAHLHLAPLDAIGAIVAAIEGPWLEAEYPPNAQERPG
jgi:hypothetical protein